MRQIVIKLMITEASSVNRHLIQWFDHVHPWVLSW